MYARRCELSDFEWSVIAPLLPDKPRGAARVDDRRVLNGIYWRLRTGLPWADIPERYGPYTTCYNHFRGAKRRVGPIVRGGIARLRGRSANDRQLIDPRSSALRKR